MFRILHFNTPLPHPRIPGLILYRHPRHPAHQGQPQWWRHCSGSSPRGHRRSMHGHPAARNAAARTRCTLWRRQHVYRQRYGSRRGLWGKWKRCYKLSNASSNYNLWVNCHGLWKRWYTLSTTCSTTLCLLFLLDIVLCTMYRVGKRVCSLYLYPAYLSVRRIKVVNLTRKEACARACVCWA
jgi:hypothetical protein